jgi:hypothetical protein
VSETVDTKSSYSSTGIHESGIERSILFIVRINVSFAVQGLCYFQSCKKAAGMQALPVRKVYHRRGQ